MILTGQGEPVRLDAAEVSASLFDILGVQPMLGRTFRADDNQPGKTHIAILGHALWRQRFGSDAGIVGRRITLDGVPYEVVGVMPERFAFPTGREIWTPLEYTDDFTVKQRGAWYLTVVGRARPGVPIEQVKAEIQTIGAQLAAQYPDSNEGLDFAAVQLHEAMVGDIRKAMLVLFGAVGFVLLIACVNVANLLLAKAAARESEIAVRTALGAGRGRLVRQLLTESLILSIVGGLLGLLLAAWGVEALLALEPQGIPRLGEVRLDPMVIGFTAAVSLVTGLLFGVFPAFQSTSAGLAAALKEGARGALSSRTGSRVRSTLVVSEIALAVTLLAGAGLLVRSFTQAGGRRSWLQRPAGADVRSDAARCALCGGTAADRVLRPAAAEARGAARGRGGGRGHGPPAYRKQFRPHVRGRRPSARRRPSQQPAMQIRVATTKYFQLIGIPLKRGRLFTDDDRAGSPPVVVITEAAARQYFPNEDPIGKKITLGWGRGPGLPRAGGEVVGVVGDIKDAGLAEADPPQLYMPYRPMADSKHGGHAENRRASGDRRRRGAPRGVLGGREPPGIERPHARTDRGALDLAAAVLHVAARGLRRGCRGAGGDRHLRRALVRGRATHA